MIPNEKMLTILISSVLVFHIFVGYALEDVYVINRNSGTKDQVRNGRDSFKIRPSKCNPLTASTGDECEPFRSDPPARNPLTCYCLCLGSRPTFAFLKNQWACFDNGEIRVLQDCNHTSYFLNEATNPPFEVWALQTSFSVSTNIPSNGLQSCEVLPNSSWYLGCNGTRVKSPVYQRKMKDLFALTNHFGNVGFNYVSLEVRGGVLNAHLLEGKIINLAIRCNLSNSNAQFHSCLMFKLKGQQICPEPEPKLYTRTTRSPGNPYRNSPNDVNASPSPGNVHSRPSSGHEGILDGRGIIAVIAAVIVSIAFLIAITVCLLFHRHRPPSKKQERDNNLFEVTITSWRISQSSHEETDVGDMIMEEASCPQRSYDYPYANPAQSFSEETDTGYMMMEGASCPERPCDYAYANPVEITPPSLISRSTRTGCVPADASANQQSPPSVEARSPAIYIVNSYEDTNNVNAKNSLFTKGTISSPISQSCPEKPETEYMTMDEFRSPAIYTEKDYENVENTHVKNGLSDQGANDERLQVDCGPSALSYENFPGSTSGHFSEERNNPEEYVEMGNRRGVQSADSGDEYGRNALPKQKEGPGNPFLVKSEESTSPTISPDKHHDNISAKNSSSNGGENDERLKLDCKACGFSYENFSGSSSGHFSAERTDPEEYVEMGKIRGVQFTDSEDKNGHNGLSKEEEERPGNLVLVETEKLRSSANSPDKHYEDISAKNDGENDERLRLDCRACGLSYENRPDSSTSRFSAERTNPVEYVEMGKRTSLQLADSCVQPGLHGFPGLTLKKRVVNI